MLLCQRLERILQLSHFGQKQLGMVSDTPPVPGTIPQSALG